ncbi:MAG: alpha/beta hydrolase [Chitinophagales bacterium]
MMNKLLSASVLIIFTSSVFALNPSREYSVVPSDYGLNYKEVSIPSTDGLKLNAWIFSPASPQKKYVIISDDGNGNMGDNLEVVGQFLSLGYIVITYDYRGFGKSDSFGINPDFFIYSQFAKDLQGVLDYLRKNYSPGYCDLYGIGMGGGLSLGLACNSTQVRRVIADGAYTSLEQAKKELKERRNLEVKLPLAYDKNLIEPQYALTQGPNAGKLMGILLITGQNSDVFGPEDVKQLQRIHPKNLEVYTVPNATNETTLSSDKDAYFNQIKKFVTTR